MLWCSSREIFFLGKRALAQKAEADFFALLRERGIAQAGAIWKEVSNLARSFTLLTLFIQAKKTISEDPRYDAVNSSSLREELFNTFLSAQSNRTTLDQPEKRGADSSPPEGDDETQNRKDRKAQAVNKREEKVNLERERVQASIEKSRIGLNREEGELQFRCAAVTYSRFCGPCAGAHMSNILLCRTLLTDAIREPQVREAFLPGQRSDQSHVGVVGTISCAAAE